MSKKIKFCKDCRHSVGDGRPRMKQTLAEQYRRAATQQKKSEEKGHKFDTLAINARVKEKKAIRKMEKCLDDKDMDQEGPNIILSDGSTITKEEYYQFWL